MNDIKSLSKRVDIIPRNKIEDSRGWFLKIITGNENGLPSFTGEIYTVCSINGASRGGHFHKEATEWFTLLTGTASLHLKDVNSNESLIIELAADDPKTIVVPPNVAHRFDAKGNGSFLIIAYTNLFYRAEDTIIVNF